MEQLDYNLLYCWFVGLGVDEPVWVPTVFTKNRDRLLEADVARKFLAELVEHKELRGLLSDGRLDCAVNNAGVVRFAPIIEETKESIDFHVDTNLPGVFYCMKHDIRQMLKNGCGAIVDQSSITGSLTGNPGESVYAATKGGGRAHQKR